MMLERIRREHGYMVRLLAILRQKRQQLLSNKPISYSLVKEVVDYFSEHSEKIHHPKEDILYFHYMNVYGHDTTIVNLAKQHEELARNTEDFLLTVEMILQDAIVPRDIFIEQLNTFIEHQKQHLESEERVILPLISSTFTTKDWQQVESQWNQSEDDPVFGDTIAERYKQLAVRVRKVDQECV